ncbi:hypothetical protein LSCM1_05581 [Leishmania martiniquensis]|uniref:Amidase domain-containing protein n=1 Tax=Leishmania martiniquensis TaxID=1580590 RepID=A0A836HS03_9TRYP|nr:hypothetical protein LSCM1_05581 [Leishmania martiniquensis]
MSSTTSSVALHLSRSSARRRVRQLHNHAEEQRRVVMECRNRAEAMSASGSLRDGPADKAGPPSPVCFAEVASEKSVMQSFISNGLLSGIAVAVSDALDVQGLFSRSGLCTPMFHHGACKEFPLLPWLRCQGAQFVGKLKCCTPFALNEGTVFGPEKPASVAVAEHACDYAIDCSLTGPPSVLCAAYRDVVGFKPTSQIFGTFTERFELPMPSMTVGLSARRVDDLAYLWQTYTSSVDPETYFDSTTTTQKQPGTASATGCTSPSLQSSVPTGSGASPSAATAGDSKGDRSAASAAGDAEPLPTMSAAEAPRGGGPSHQRSSDPAARLARFISSWWSGNAAPEVKHPDDMPKYALPDILDHSPYNYTVRDRRGHIADIDVGWRDYNVKAAMTDDFHQPSRPGLLRRLLTGVQAYETPRVELAVGYPAEWIDRYCTGKYTSSAEFRQRITDAVHRHSALHYNQKLEIVPLAFDYSLEEVMEAAAVISNYEIAKAFEREFAPSATPAAAVCAKATTRSGEDPKGSEACAQSGHHGDRNKFSAASCPEKVPELPGVPGAESIELSGRDAPAPNRPSTFLGLSDAQEGLPVTLLDAIQAGQNLSVRDYHCALRVRDDVVRCNEEQFMDVDCFVTPLLSDPYVSGDVRSVRLMLPFQLAGNPLLSVQMDPQTPVALVGELGRDAALMEDALCFLQFVRGVSPSWWHQTVFGRGTVAAPAARKDCSPEAGATTTSSPPADSTALVT